jgi:hypothetical protein
MVKVKGSKVQTFLSVRELLRTKWVVWDTLDDLRVVLLERERRRSDHGIVRAVSTFLLSFIYSKRGALGLDSFAPLGYEIHIQSYHP